MQNLIKQISDINQQMLILAEQTQWQDLSDKMNQRQQILESFFNTNKSPLTADQASNLSLIIVNTDEKIQACINQERKSVISSSLDLKKAQTALKAYKSSQNSLNEI